MSLHRHAAKRDESEPEIVEAFLDGNASVVKHSGAGELDLVVGYKGVDHWCENKTGSEPLTEKQKEFIRTWKGAPPVTCRNAAQARALLAKWDREFAEQAKRRDTIEDDLGRRLA